jgi:hypothetical protein
MAGNESIGGAPIKGRAIFISYRRDDTEGESGRLYDDLVRAYGDDSVFMDVAGIQPGLDFRKAIDDNVAGCGVLLAIIGPTWATITGHDGTRRLDNPDDYVRLEIASALKRGVPVIPVLVHESHMPALDQLPDDLKDLRYRNSAELTHARWSSDVALLVAALKSYVSAKPANPEQPVHANLPVQLPAPQGPELTPVAKTKSLLPLGIGVAVLLIAGIFVFLHFHNAPAPVPSPQTQTTNAVPAPTQPQTGVAAGPSPTTGSGAEAALLGQWKITTEPGIGDDLARLSIADVNGQLMVEGWGNCPKRDCHWPSQKATLQGTMATTEPLTLTNTPEEIKEKRSVILSIQPSDTGLGVMVQNTYHRPNGQTVMNSIPRQFVKTP